MIIRNPVIEKELKTKMRGWKSPALITGYLAFLVLVIYLYFLASGQLEKYSMQYFNPRVALNSYYFLASFQFGVLLLIVPALTGGAICGERERQTLDLLLCTNFPAISIITGKLIVSIAHILLLLIASLPVLGSVFLFGGIGVSDILLLSLFYIVTAFMVGSLGIFYSTIFKKTITSIIVTYITLLVLLFGTLIIMFVWGSVNRIQNFPRIEHLYAFLFSNPIFGFVSIMEGLNGGYGISTIFGIGYGSTQLANTWVKPWMINAAFDILVTIVLVLISTRRIKPVKGISKLKNKEGKKQFVFYSSRTKG
ncbi:MAG TPA: ABC transporter permease subunit [Clostridiales bacterium]|nr:ABC transporter permease subunit [Clostridiales bacterium]